MSLDGRGVEKDAHEAAEWIYKAAVGGLVDAQFQMAGMYWDGVGIDKDNQSPSIGTRAAKQGHAMAQFNLGIMYEKGFGVKADLKQAWNGSGGRKKRQPTGRPQDCPNRAAVKSQRLEVAALGRSGDHAQAVG